MKKYKIDNYIVTANSVHDAVTIVKRIQASAKDAETHSIKFIAARAWDDPSLGTSKLGGWTTPEKLNSWLKNDARKYYNAHHETPLNPNTYIEIHVELKYLVDGKKYYKFATKIDEKYHPLTERIIKWGAETIEDLLNGDQGAKRYAAPLTDSSVFNGNPEKGAKDSLTVREVIESLVTEETSAIASYNVALETLRDHIPAEAYEAIKAIRDDEQRHVENLYAVLNGNVTSKNLEN